MTVNYTHDRLELAHRIEPQITQDSYTAIADLPNIAGFDSQPSAIWLFAHPNSYEIAIPAGYSYSGENTFLGDACASEPLPGGFQSVAVFERRSTSLGQLVRFIVEELLTPSVVPLLDDSEPDSIVVSRPLDVERAQEDQPESLRADRPITDLDAVLRVSDTASIPTAEELASTLGLTVKGQGHALSAVADAIVAHLHKPSPELPVRLMLVGSSGVGKSATAKALVTALNDLEGQEWSFVQVDCNQLSEASSISQLLGSSAGYVGYGDGSPLVQTLATNPRCVVFFDEIDKAHPDVLTALMSVMSDGELQLRQPIGGRWRLNCRQAILLFASNQAAHEIVEQSSNNPHRLETLARNALIATGMPEWLAGRHGTIAVFTPITRETAAEILTLEVVRHACEFDLDVQWIEPEVIATMLVQSDLSHTGARGLRRMVERFCGPGLVEYRAGLSSRAKDDGGACRVDQASSDLQSVVLCGNPCRAVPSHEWFETLMNESD